MATLHASGTQCHSNHACTVYCISLPALVQVILARGVLIHVAALLDKAFRGKPTSELYFVMVMCPLCMNLVQVDLVSKQVCRSAASVSLAEQCIQQSEPVISSLTGSCGLQLAYGLRLLVMARAQ